MVSAMRPQLAAGGAGRVVRRSWPRRYWSGLIESENAVALTASVIVVLVGTAILWVARTREIAGESAGGEVGRKAEAGLVVPAALPVEEPGAGLQDDRVAGVELSGPF